MTVGSRFCFWILFSLCLRQANITNLIFFVIVISVYLLIGKGMEFIVLLRVHDLGVKE